MPSRYQLDKLCQVVHDEDMQTTVQTPYGEVQVTVEGNGNLVVTTGYGDDYPSLIINGVKIDVRWELIRVEDNDVRLRCGDEHYVSGHISLQRRGWQNWNKLVSDSARRKIRAEVLPAAVAAMAENPDLIHDAAIEEVKRAIMLKESEALGLRTQASELEREVQALYQDLRTLQTEV